MENKDRPVEDLVFRYSREDRLKRSSEAVRKLNDPALRKRPSLIQTLVPNRASAFLLLGIFMLASTVVVTRLLVPPRNKADVAGNRLTLTAFRFQGGTYLALKKHVFTEKAYQGPVDVVVTGGDKREAISTRRIVFAPAVEEDFRFAVDGEHEMIEAAVSAGPSRAILKTETD
jgi:hypothetical protein